MNLDPGRTLDRLLSAIADRNLHDTLACFSSDDDVAVLGSERGEEARGRRAIKGFFSNAYANPGAYRFELPDRTVSARGDVAWLVAGGTVIEPGETESKPYRLTAVFVRTRGRWQLVLWSGSEPVADASGKSISGECDRGSRRARRRARSRCRFAPAAARCRA